MASPYASAAKIASAEAKLGGPIAQDSSLLLKQLVVALGNVTGGGGGSGTVTSVAQSFTGGLISVAGSPITTSGTLALTVAGTSGGIPYFSSASTWASSAALAANALVVGGGAGAAPSTVTTGTGVVTALGVNVGTAGAFVVNGGALGTPSSGTLTNCTLPASGITGTLAAAKGGTGVANGASCTLTLPNAATTITTGGTLALGGFTLTVPATGTAALLGTANAFTAAQTITSTVGATALTLAGGTQTSSFPVLDMTQTWNSAGVAFTALKLNITNTASENSSRLIDLQFGGTTKFSVIPTSTGAVVELGGGANAGIGISLASNVATIGRSNGDGGIDGSTDVASWGNNNNLFAVNNVLSIGRPYASRDLFLARKAAATLQLGEDAAGVTNQTLTAANRITSDGVGANLTIAAGNGLGAAGGSLILSTFTTAGAGTVGTLTSRLTIDTSGNIALPNVTAVTTETVISDRTWPISINGVTYKICLKA